MPQDPDPRGRPRRQSSALRPSPARSPDAGKPTGCAHLRSRKNRVPAVGTSPVRSVRKTRTSPKHGMDQADRARPAAAGEERVVHGKSFQWRFQECQRRGCAPVPGAGEQVHQAHPHAIERRHLARHLRQMAPQHALVLRGRDGGRLLAEIEDGLGEGSSCQACMSAKAGASSAL